MASQPRPRLGLRLDTNLTVSMLIFLYVRLFLGSYGSFLSKTELIVQVLDVVDGGACSGFLHVGDTITQVNSVSVVGREPQDAQTVFEQSCTSLGMVVLHIDRPCNGMLQMKNHECSCALSD